MPITELSAAIERRALSPVEITLAFLERIDAVDRSVNSYRVVTADRARADARAAEAEIAAGRRRGPLHGIPIALKDNFDTAGIATSASSRVLGGRVPTNDAAAASALSRAGAVMLGKLNMSEFAIGPSYEDDFEPPARNPWNTGRVTGGSSSGSAAAAAAGLCAGSLGSDTGGSIRLPAAYTGVVGLKPTYDLLSRRGVIPLSWSLDHVGPLARTVSDVALLLEATSGVRHGGGPQADVVLRDASSELGASLQGVRIGIPEAWMASVVIEADVVVAFRAAIEVLRTLGANVRTIEVPGAADAPHLITAIMASEALAYHEPWLRSSGDRYGRQCRSSILGGLAFGAADYLQAQRSRQVLREVVEGAMRDIDVIATPAQPRTAPTRDEHERRPPANHPFLGLFNLTGQPSISVPCGFDRNSMPIGLLLSGRPFDEATVLRIAARYELSTEWHRRHPSLA